tara:strand:+ start:16376 stop:17569 length:1194 start_codon:yes stop_codon:yes gene_type:complete
MESNSHSLFVEINNYEFTFIVTKNFEDNGFKLIYKKSLPLEGISKNQISDSERLKEIFKKNIYLIEQKLNFVFKEVILILDNFNYSLINFAGYRKLNGSQLVKENITYILNSLKSKISVVEDDKKVLHIFNSKYFLDKKEVENLPIGLFGDFYTHELSFFLIKNNDYLNLKNIFNKCNLRLKKVISKNFISGAYLIKENSNLNTLFRIEIDNISSKIIFFENSSLKFVQDFKFGLDIIINDISKIVGLKKQIIMDILTKFDFNSSNLNNELLEKEFFSESNFRKIKKQLIIEIANARIEEILDIIIFNNINLTSFLKKEIPIFLKIRDETNKSFFKNSFKSFFTNKKFELHFIDHENSERIYEYANEIVQYGWKKEAVPIVQEKKSIIAKIFEFFSS